MIQTLTVKSEHYLVTRFILARIRKLVGNSIEQFKVVADGDCLFVRGRVSTYFACQLVEREVKEAAEYYEFKTSDISVQVS